MSGRFTIGSSYDFTFAPRSTVVGTDQYTLYSYTGRRKTWTSYTLESADQGVFKRWWLSDEAAGLYCWTASDTPPRGELVLEESGLCKLLAAGDSTIETPYSAVLFYRDGDVFSCAEVFEGDVPVFYMTGRKITI
jgi:hypothetical protein